MKTLKERIIEGALDDFEIGSRLRTYARRGAESRAFQRSGDIETRFTQEEFDEELRRSTEGYYKDVKRGAKYLTLTILVGALTIGSFFYGACKLNNYLKSQDGIRQVELMGLENKK